MPRRPRKKKSPDANGLSVGRDYFTNALARMGYGTPSLPEATEYEMVRLSNNYWLMLTLYRNHWIARRVVDLPAQDMTRSWPKLNCDVAPEDIQDFDRTVQKTFTPHHIRRAIKWARLYGGAGALMAIKGHEEFLDQPLDPDDINPGSYLGLIPFDRWVGISPNATQISQDFNRPADWGLPEYYECTAEDKAKSFNVHCSRILRFQGPDVPTPEFQAQQYWGISELEVIWEELRKRDNASFAILNLIYRANILARKDPELAQIMSGLGVSQQAAQRWAASLQAQNELLNNQSMLVLGKDGEMQSVQYTFSGIGEVYAQFQMDIAGAAQIPVTRLFGRTVTGLGQSNDADERYYEESIAQKQNEELRPQLDKLYPVICMSEFGEIPDDLDFNFPSIRVLTEEEKAEMTEKASAPVLAAYNSGVISQKTTLKELRQLSDTTGVFSNITDEDIDAAEDEPMMPGEGNEAEGAEAEGDPSPERALRKESAGAEA
jgi:phage-related protein (TIGR01555 family)